MNVTEALELRRAIPSFDSSVSIDRNELLAILDRANLAPSSMNMQPWEYIIVESDEDKARLHKVAMNQKKILEASAVVVLLGNLNQYDNAPRVVQSNIDNGYYGEDRREGAIAAPKSYWAGNPVLARDEAFRGCSLWAMAFMLAAMEANWDTAPMSGFVPDALVEEFGVPETRVPIMLICIGKRNLDVHVRGRSIRFPASEVAHFGQY